MSAFTGVSVVTGGEHCTTSAIDAGTDIGYHLLVVKDYSRTVQVVPNGEEIRSGHFMVGGLKWCIWYCPNGFDKSSTDFISIYVCRVDPLTEGTAKVHASFSFVDQVEYQKPMYIRATKQHSLSSKLRGWGSVDFLKRDRLERSTHLKDDCFTIRCDILVCKDPNTQDVGRTMSDIGECLDHLLKNKVGVDVTFEVGGKMFPAHRCVLAARSKVFMAQLFGPMAEGNMSSAIQIKDMEPKVFAALLSFIYTGSFPDMEEDEAAVEGHEGEAVEDKLPAAEEEGQGNEAVDDELPADEEEEETIENVMWVQSLFVAADRYDLQKLKLLCEEYLSEDICVSSVASSLALAEQYNCHGLKEACLKFIQVQSIPCLEKLMATDGWELIFTTYPSVVKEIIVKVASSQKSKKRKR